MNTRTTQFLLALFMLCSIALQLNAQESSAINCEIKEEKTLYVNESTKLIIKSPFKINSFTFSDSPTDSSTLISGLHFEESTASFNFHLAKNNASQELENTIRDFDENHESEELHKMIAMIYDDFFEQDPKNTEAKVMDIKTESKNFTGKGYMYTDGAKQLDFYNIKGTVNGKKIYIMYRDQKEQVDHEIDYSLIECILNNLEL